MNPDGRTALLQRMGRKFGLTPDVEDHLRLFTDRVERVTKLSSDRVCLMYVDAEQTYVQEAIELFAKQMHLMCRRDRAIIMNGF